MRRRGRCRCRGRASGRESGRESGQVMVMVMGFGVMILLLISLVIGASKYFLYHRGLHAIADGAALAGTNGIDASAIYEGGVGDRVVLDEAAVRREVQAYVAAVSSGPGSLSEFSCPDVSVQGAVVTVGCTGTVQMPVVNLVTSSVTGGGGIPVSVVASSEAFTSG